MKKPIIFIFLALFLFCCFAPSVKIKSYAKSVDDQGEKPKITAKSALLLDYNSGTVIFAKNEEARLPVASMTKLASLSIILDAIDKGAIKENDLVKVSKNAASVGGSSAFLDAGSSYKVSELIKSVVIASANDSCVALAEHVAGTEDVFVSRMNKLAKTLGLKNTNFVNATGLPAENHYSCAVDMSKIYRTVCGNSLYKKYAKIWMDDFIHPSGRKTGLVNTNRLIKTFEGIEGGKTGYTDAAKFCLTASATRGTTRLIAVVIGASDSKTRFAEVSNLLNFGFANFESKLVVNSQIPVTNIAISKSKARIDVFPARDGMVFTSKLDDQKYTTDFKLNEVSAPVKKGQVVGKLFIFDKNNMVVDEIELISGGNAFELKFKDRLFEVISNW